MAQMQKSGGGGAQELVGRLPQIAERAAQNLADGAVTAGYKANRDAILDLLNRALAGEWSAMLQYEHHWTMASDIHGAEIGEMWKEHADEEHDHARKLNERINQLGGVPANDPLQIQQLTATPFKAGHGLRDMLQQDLIYERATIEFYNEIIRVCAFDDNETRAVFEDILLGENEHANELSNLLYQFDASSGKQIAMVHEEALQQRARSAGQ